MILSKLFFKATVNHRLLFYSKNYAFGILKFNLPDLGEKIKEGTIKKLYVQQGQEVTQFQKIADIASDKQFTQITASDNGVIKKIHYKEEQVCQVGALFMELEVSGDKTTSKTGKKMQQVSKQKPQQKIKNPSSQGQVSSSSVLASPFVRGLMKKNNISDQQISSFASGNGGRVLQSDIEKFLQSRAKPAEDSKPHPARKQQKTNYPEVSFAGSKSITMNNFQKGMQKSMTQSNKIPHLYLHQQFDLTQTEKMRKTIKNNNQKVTVMGILIKTFSIALKKFPQMNAIYEPHKNQFQYTLNSEHNISIAIDSPNGLVVPNIKSVNAMNLGKIQSELQRLRNLAAQAKLTAKDLNYGTVCLSNIGTIAGTMACPLILPPQVCIVAIGKIQILPKYLKGSDQPMLRSILNVSYGCDHRVIDGATVARFSNEWKRIIQNPYLALAQMS